MSDNSKTQPVKDVVLHEIEEWQASFYDDVHDLFARGDENRGNIAFANWEKRFKTFLEKQLPNKNPDYVSQTKTRNRTRLAGMTSLEYFTQRKGAMVRAFIDQLIDDAKKGYLDTEYVMDDSKKVDADKMKSDTLKIFISHSSRDIELVALIVELLRSALNLSAKDIRCTSLDGYRNVSTI